MWKETRPAESTTCEAGDSVVVWEYTHSAVDLLARRSELHHINQDTKLTSPIGANSNGLSIKVKTGTQRNVFILLKGLPQPKSKDI